MLGKGYGSESTCFRVCRRGRRGWCSKHRVSSVRRGRQRHGPVCTDIEGEIIRGSVADCEVTQSGEEFRGSRHGSRTEG